METHGHTAVGLAAHVDIQGRMFGFGNAGHRRAGAHEERAALAHALDDLTGLHLVAFAQAQRAFYQSMTHGGRPTGPVGRHILFLHARGVLNTHGLHLAAAHAEADGGHVARQGAVRAAPLDVQRQRDFHLLQRTEILHGRQAGRQREIGDAQRYGAAQTFQRLFQRQARRKRGHACGGYRGAVRIQGLEQILQPAEHGVAETALRGFLQIFGHGLMKAALPDGLAGKRPFGLRRAHLAEPLHGKRARGNAADPGNHLGQHGGIRPGGGRGPGHHVPRHSVDIDRPAAGKDKVLQLRQGTFGHGPGHGLSVEGLVLFGSLLRRIHDRHDGHPAQVLLLRCVESQLRGAGIHGLIRASAVQKTLRLHGVPGLLHGGKRGVLHHVAELRIAQKLSGLLTCGAKHGLAEQVLKLLPVGGIHGVRGAEGVEGRVEIAGVAAAVVGQHEMTRHICVDAAEPFVHGGGIGQDVARGAGTERHALLPEGPHAGGKRIGHRIAVLLTHGGKKHVARVTVGALPGKERPYFAPGLESAVLHDDARVVAHVRGKMREIVKRQSDGPAHDASPDVVRSLPTSSRRADALRPPRLSRNPPKLRPRDVPTTLSQSGCHGTQQGGGPVCVTKTTFCL